MTSATGTDLDPPERFAFESHDEDQIVDFFGRLYADNRLSFEGRGEDGARLAATTADVEGLGGDHLTSNRGFSMQIEGAPEFLTYLVESGGVSLRRGREEVRLGEGDTTIYPLQVAQQFEVTPMRARALRLPMARIADVASEVGWMPADDFRFLGTTPVSSTWATFWRAQVRFVTGALLATDSPMSRPLMQEETIRSTALAALHAFPNTALNADHVPAPGAVAPAALRRAVEHIEAHAGEALTLAQIASVARTSPRAVQYAFRRAYDTTPMGYVRRVRLERAHRDLQDGDPTRGDTVAAIAVRWGFAKPGRFAAAYATTYGRPPSHTLRR